MEYTLQTRIVTEDGEQILDRREAISADEVIKMLRPKAVDPLEQLLVSKKPKKVYEKKTYKVAGETRKVNKPNIGSGTNGRSKSELRDKVIAWTEKGWKPQEIADKLGIPKANVYYYQKGLPSKTYAKGSETPEKVGEREIDQPAKRLSENDFLEIKHQREDNNSFDIIGLNFPDYQKDEIKRAMSFNDYQAYSDSK